jgi:hypothetical protein
MKAESRRNPEQVESTIGRPRTATRAPWVVRAWRTFPGFLAWTFYQDLRRPSALLALLLQRGSTRRP